MILPFVIFSKEYINKREKQQDNFLYIRKGEREWGYVSLLFVDFSLFQVIIIIIHKGAYMHPINKLNKFKKIIIIL